MSISRGVDEIVTITQTSTPDLETSQVSNEVTILLKDEDELVGGITVQLGSNVSYILRLWLKPQIRGYSFGSILLSEAIIQTKARGARELRMGTHLKYIQFILQNNQFKQMKHFIQGNNTYTFYQCDLDEAKSFSFTHPYTLVKTPSVEEAKQFSTRYEQEVTRNFGFVKPISLKIEDGEHAIGQVSGYLAKDFLYIDRLDEVNRSFISNDELENVLTQYAKTLHVSELYYTEPWVKEVSERELKFKKKVQYA